MLKKCFIFKPLENFYRKRSFSDYFAQKSPAVRGFSGWKA
jgi:hypothetical protein